MKPFRIANRKGADLQFWPGDGFDTLADALSARRSCANYADRRTAIIVDAQGGIIPSLASCSVKTGRP